MALPEHQRTPSNRRDLHKLPLAERFRVLGISLDPPTPEQLEQTRNAVRRIKAWAERVGPIGVSGEELLRHDDDLDVGADG